MVEKERLYIKYSFETLLVRNDLERAIDGMTFCLVFYSLRSRLPLILDKYADLKSPSNEKACLFATSSYQLLKGIYSSVDGPPPGMLTLSILYRPHPTTICLQLRIFVLTLKLNSNSFCGSYYFITI